MIPSPPSTVRRSAASKHRANADTIDASSTGSGEMDASFWAARSVYPAPAPPSGSHCVLQNDLLCVFGGLQQECPGLLFRIVPRDVALQPSSRVVYTSLCRKLGLPSVHRIADQLSTTPGQYLLAVLDISGLSMTTASMATLTPVLVTNRDALTVLQLRSCNLHDGGWKQLASILCNVEEPFHRLATLELSCNHLDDVDASLITGIVNACPQLKRVGLLKNSISKPTLAAITSLLHERFRSKSPRPPSRQSESVRRAASLSSGAVGRSRSPVQTEQCAYATLVAPEYPKPGDAVRLPKISKSDFLRAVGMYRQLMTVQTALLDLYVLQKEQPAIFEVFRKQTSAMPNVEYATLPRYLCACFPSVPPNQVMYALSYFSEYSLTTALRKVTHEGLRADQKAEVQRIFRCLDKTHSGVLPEQVLSPPRASAAEIAETHAMLTRLNISELNFDAFASIVAPYLVETRRRRRLR